MQTFTRGRVVLLVALASACSGGSNTATSPSRTPTPPPAPPTTIVLTGQVVDRVTSAPISGATVRIDGRDRTTTDSSGSYSLTGLLYAGSFTYVSANNYAGDARYIRGTSQNIRLHRIERITAGESWSVTVAPDDSLCYNNVQDQPGVGQDYVCRSVRIVVPTDGIMTLEALPTQGGAHPPLVVETVGIERMGNPSSIRVTAGTEVVANVEMVLGSTTSQSFTLTTSMAGQ